jgi:hypothetical protein
MTENSSNGLNHLEPLDQLNKLADSSLDLGEAEKHFKEKYPLVSSDAIAPTPLPELTKERVAGEISDGFHTFNELYMHRNTLAIALAKALGDKAQVWCSTKDSTGNTMGDWFLFGINKRPGRQITYHMPAALWSQACEVATVLEQAPEWDGHTSRDVLNRIPLL